MAILFANATIGVLQDYRAEKAIDALKDLQSPNATVLRDTWKEIPAKELVPGDIVKVWQVEREKRIVKGATRESSSCRFKIHPTANNNPVSR